jgi:hypothetical protein
MSRWQFATRQRTTTDEKSVYRYRSPLGESFIHECFCLFSLFQISRRSR